MNVTVKSSGTDQPANELLVLILLAGIQFTHIVDFMIMMPLGPQLMRVMSISTREFGLLVSAYTFGAALSGFFAAFHIDRFDRKKTLLAIYLAFVGTTLLCAFAQSFATLLAARAVSGVFGGIAGAAVYAILGDLIPEARRGKATGIVASSFSVSAVVGVPIGLFLSNHFAWRAPFLFLSALSLLLWLLAWRVLPSMRRHLRSGERNSVAQTLRAVFVNRNHLNAFALTATLMFAGFSVIPFISPYMVANVGLRESDLPYLYLTGGLATFFTSQWIGRLSDQHGKLKLFRIVGAISIVPLLLTTHLPPVPVPIAIIASVIFMVFVSGRFVPVMALVNASTLPRTRGSFLAFNASIQQLFAGLAAFCAGLIMGHNESGQITHYGLVGLIAVSATLACLYLAGRVRSAEQTH